MGLGGFPAVSLAQAREKAKAAQALVREGKDPIKECERREAERGSHFLKDIAADAFEARKAQLKGDGKAGRWFSPLELHILPKLGGVPVGEIDQRDIRDTLRPIWHEKAETAEKALQRLSICLQYAAALGPDVDLQAPAKAKALLGAHRRQRPNIPSLPWQDVPTFYGSLDERSICQLALRLLNLTAARSSEVRSIHLSEIQGEVWTIPAERMKTGVEHRIPLSDEALIRSVPKYQLYLERSGPIAGGFERPDGLVNRECVRDQGPDIDALSFHELNGFRKFVVKPEGAAKRQFLGRHCLDRQCHVAAEAKLHDGSARAHGGDGGAERCGDA
jgi:integrase